MHKILYMLQQSSFPFFGGEPKAVQFNNTGTQQMSHSKIYSNYIFTYDPYILLELFTYILVTQHLNLES